MHSFQNRMYILISLQCHSKDLNFVNSFQIRNINMESKFSNYICVTFTPLNIKYMQKKTLIQENLYQKVIMEFMEPYLDTERVLCADNWYNRVDLVEKLLDRNTHLVETLGPNQKCNQKCVTKKNILRDTIAKINN